MRRHPAFQDLSRDHYAALLACQKVRRAVAGHPRAGSLAEATSDLLLLWNSALQLHFEEEDEDLLPVLDAKAPELAKRLRSEHADLRESFGNLKADKPDSEAFDRVAELLQNHIRWEEDVLFEWLQQNLAEEELQKLWQRSRRFRIGRRGPESVQEPSPTR